MNRQDPTVRKKYTRVENRKDYVLPENVEILLNELENTGDLNGILSPQCVHERLLLHYTRFHSGVLSREESKDIINKAWNLSRPTLHQVIRKFHKTLDVYPHVRDDILSDCSIVVTKTFLQKKYDVSRGTRMTSYLFEFFIYATLGILSRYFKEKRAYICVDPDVMGKVFSGDEGRHSQEYDQE